METSSAEMQSSTFSIISSKTGSSRSDEVLEEEDRDYTKDNSASPIDLECLIQQERITKILDEAIYSTKLALCLPALVTEYSLLSSTLTPQHFDDLIFIFEQYESSMFSESLLNLAALDDLKAGDTSLKNRLNPELGHLMYILNSYPALRPRVEQMIDEAKAEYAADADESHEPQPGLDYLQTLEHFRELMVTQLSTTAAEELAAKIKTRKLESSNNDLIENINECARTIRDENDAFEKTMKAKSEEISRLEQELAQLNYESSLKLKKQILDSDRQMVLASRAHQVKNEMLLEEEQECRDAYESLLRGHLIDEKNQRARRFKVETQLMSWIQKYDVEMSDKQVELDEYIEKLKDENNKIQDLEAKIEEQNKEYIPLMEEREKEYHQEMTEKMEKFLVEHAARVIQTAWREVLFNRAEKRRLKKLIKKKQEAEAAAQAAAEKAARLEAIKARKEAAAAKKAEKEAAKEAKQAAKEAAAKAAAEKAAAEKERAKQELLEKEAEMKAKKEAQKQEAEDAKKAEAAAKAAAKKKK